MSNFILVIPVVGMSLMMMGVNIERGKIKWACAHAFIAGMNLGIMIAGLITALAMK